MRKILFLFMFVIPLLSLAASGVLTAQGSVNGLPVSRDQNWEVWCDSSKDQIQIQNHKTGDLITFKKSGDMSSNGALCYNAYYRGQLKLSNVWIRISISEDEIISLSIKTHYGTTYFN